jgi:hypothetical protein
MHLTSNQASTSTPPIWMARGLSVNLLTYSFMASMCNSEFTLSRSPSAYRNFRNYALRVDVQEVPAGQWWYRRGQSDGEYVFGRPQSSKASSYFRLILSYTRNTRSVLPNSLSHSSHTYRARTTLGDKFQFDVVRGALEGWWWVINLLAQMFHPNGLQVVCLKVLSLGISRCSSDYSGQPSAARLTLPIYIETSVVDAILWHTESCVWEHIEKLTGGQGASGCK